MRMRTFAFRKRIFFVYTAVIVAVVALFSAVLLVTTIDGNRKAELTHQQELYKKNLAEVEGIFRQMERLALQIVSNNEVLASFIPLAEDGEAENSFARNLIDSIRISSLLSSVNGTDRYAARISVFNGGGDYISTGTLYETPEVIAGTLRGDHYEALKARVLQLGGESLVEGFHADQWSNNPGPRLVSLYRALSSFTSTVYGLVDVQVSAEVFEQKAFWGEDGAEYLLIDRDGAIVYPFVTEDRLNGLLAALIRETDAAPGLEMAAVSGRADGEGVIVMGARVPPSDWLFVRVLPERALLSPYVNTIVITAVACLVLLVCLVAVMYYLAARLAGPLQSLAATVAGVNLQNMQSSIAGTGETYATAELDALSRAFHAMLIRLDRSIATELQAHMRALQSQMNPHFLFNMLSVIIASCEEVGAERTVPMCMKLSAMLRYIADFNGDSATLEDEIRHARNYLDLMKDRYEDQFDYAIVAEGDVRSLTVPKIVVQPLVENCFTHGFADRRPPWRIDMEAKVGEGRWTLKVTDNGAGMAEETIASVYERVSVYRSDMATSYPALRLGGMGLINTMLRLSLTHGEPIEFSIESRVGRGTTIQMGGRLRDTGIDR